MKRLNAKLNCHPYLDKIIFVAATTYSIIICIWLFKQYQQSVVINSNTPSEISELQSEEVNTDFEATEDILNYPEIVSITKPGEIPPLPMVTELISVNPPEPISPLPIPSPPPLPAPVSLPIISVNEQEVVQRKQPPQKAQPVPIPSPPPMTSVPILSPPPSEDSEKNASLSRTKISQSQDKNYSLLGIMELPNNENVALFKVGDLTERVMVGGAIASTGWTVVSIYNNEVIINRNNQSLPIRVGEKF